MTEKLTGTEKLSASKQAIVDVIKEMIDDGTLKRIRDNEGKCIGIVPSEKPVP